MIVAVGPSIRSAPITSRYSGVLTYPVHVRPDRTLLAAFIPLQLQYFLTVWPLARLYSKVKLLSWHVTFTPSLSMSRDGTISMMFDPDISRVQLPQEDNWAQSRNVKLVRASIFRPHDLTFQATPEYHEGGITALDRIVTLPSYRSLQQVPTGWELSNAGVAVPVRCSYGTSVTPTGGSNPLTPGLFYITHDVFDASAAPGSTMIAGYFNFHVEVSFSQMELGGTEDAVWEAPMAPDGMLQAQGQEVIDVAPSPDPVTWVPTPIVAQPSAEPQVAPLTASGVNSNE